MPGKRLLRGINAMAELLERDVIELGDRAICDARLRREGYSRGEIARLLDKSIERARLMRAVQADLWAVREIR
jgi:hypothetical protein